MFSSSKCVLGADAPSTTPSWALYSVGQTRAIEALALQGMAPHSLIGPAGVALARLTLAYAPQASQVWVASGPGNNGADGLSAAVELKKRGMRVVVTLLQSETPGKNLSLWIREGVEAGLEYSATPPEVFDVAVDALFGIGVNRPLPAQASAWVHGMNASPQPVIAADVPSGLQADTGYVDGDFVRARATLSFLTLKPGLFTAFGRDACGDVWIDELNTPIQGIPHALTNAQPAASQRMHASHKGTFGDVCVVGGARGMTGAALLAGTAALHAGAGRVFVSFADDEGPKWSGKHPELMLRPITNAPIGRAVVVAGCGGGQEVAVHLPAILREAPYLVLDADALNQIATISSLRQLLQARAEGTTIVTPHPLEAARLLGCNVEQVQRDRVEAAAQLATDLHCVVILKGSGTVIATPADRPVINLTGNGLLASAGTGDVLAGYLGALWAQGRSALEAAREACFWHGHCADQWPSHEPLTASMLAQKLTRR